jgi:hypothetical protein
MSMLRLTSRSMLMASVFVGAGYFINRNQDTRKKKRG